MGTVIPDEALDGIRVFFPDPWPKKRHHKRRLINPEFVSLAAHKLKPGGIFHAATDWEDYAEQMLAILDSSPLLKNCSATGFSPRPDYRPLTKFERRGQRLGHAVRDLIFTRITAKTDHSFVAAEPTADSPPPVDRDRQ
jgi:tRNA (guanine-N7-)-methyltransferase